MHCMEKLHRIWIKSAIIFMMNEIFLILKLVAILFQECPYSRVSQHGVSQKQLCVCVCVCVCVCGHASEG